MTMKQENEKATCNHCNICYPATKDFFQLINGVVRVSYQCKKCKNEKAKEKGYEKNRPPRPPRDRKEYYKAYYLNKKLKKEALKNNKDT